MAVLISSELLFFQDGTSHIITSLRDRSVFLAGWRAGHEAGGLCISAPVLLHGVLLHHDAVPALWMALVHGVVTDQSPREGIAVVAALRNIPIGFT
jgi:hypothetical protein